VPDDYGEGMSKNHLKNNKQTTNSKNRYT